MSYETEFPLGFVKHFKQNRLLADYIIFYLLNMKQERVDLLSLMRRETTNIITKGLKILEGS